MTLPDTSAWIEYLRGTRSLLDRRMIELVETDAELAVTEPIEMELLNGERSGSGLEASQRFLRSFTWMPFVTSTDFIGATAIYRTCRRQGVTPRGSLDCMIAAVALRNDAVLLAADVDLVRIAQIMGIRLDPASVLP